MSQTSPAAFQQVHNTRHRLACLRARRDDTQHQMDALTLEQTTVEIAAAEAELEAAVEAPVAGGVDPTSWLPNELMIMLLLRVGWGMVRGRVCRRWHTLLQDPVLQRTLCDQRWEGYASGRWKPRVLPSDRGVESVAIGRDGVVYCVMFMSSSTIKCISPIDGTLLRTLEGHTSSVNALFAGHDGCVYSGSCDNTVRVWSGEDGRVRRQKIRTLKGHTRPVTSLAGDTTGRLYSGSIGGEIRMWLCETGEHIKTLIGHMGAVRALVVGHWGELYSGSGDATIRVWKDGVHTRTLEGHTQSVRCLAMGCDGMLVSGSHDRTARVWSCADLSIVRTIRTDSAVRAVAVGSNGIIFVGLEFGRVEVNTWNSKRLAVQFNGSIEALEFDSAGSLYVGTWSGNSDSRVCVL